MKQLFSRTALAVCLACGLLTVSSSGLDSPGHAAQKESETKQTPAPKTRKAPRGRVPNYYGKLGLSGKQKEDIYAIQKKYREQMVDLQKQLAALREKQSVEIEAVLKDDQKAQLKKLTAEAEARRKQRAAEADK